MLAVASVALYSDPTGGEAPLLEELAGIAGDIVYMDFFQIPNISKFQVLLYFGILLNFHHNTRCGQILFFP